MSTKWMTLLAVSAGMTAFVAYRPLLAQQADQPAAANSSGLEEIVVTARRREEQLQTVPITITAFSQADLTEKNITTGTDLMNQAPELFFFEANSRNSASRPFIRNVPGVVVYIADAPGAISGSSAFWDLENLQVLVGPQGTLGGLNALGGAILVNPKKPTNNFEGSIEAQFGNYNDQFYQAVANIPIVPDKVLLRVGGQRESRDGYTHDMTFNKDLDNRDNWETRAGLTIRPTDDIENYLLFRGYYSDTHGTGSVLTYVNVPGVTPLTPNNGTAFVVFNNPVVGGAKILQAWNNQVNMGIRNVAIGDRELNFTNQWSLTDVARWDVADNFYVKNIFSYTETVTDQVLDTDAVPLQINDDPVRYVGVQGQPIPQHSTPAVAYTDELRLQGTLFNDKLNWLIGNYSEFDHPAFVRTKCGSTIVLGNFNLNCAYSTTLARYEAIFAEESYDFGGLFPSLEGLSLTLGYRYNWNYSETNAYGIAPTGKCTITRTDSNCFATGAPQRFHYPGWTTSLDYQINPDTLVYVTSRRAESGGSFNPANPVGYQTVLPERVTDVEVGVKSEFTIMGVTARTNADVWQMWYDDIGRTIAILTTNAAGQTVFTTVTANAAEAVLKGWDFQATVIPVKDVTVSLNWAHTNGGYTKWQSADTAHPGQFINLASSALVESFMNVVSATVRYQLPIDPAWGDASLSVTASQRGHTWTDPNEAVGNLLPGYSLLGLNADWNNVFEHPIDLTFFMTNALNTVYKVSGVPIGAALGIITSVYGEPRMFGASIRYRFGPGSEHEEAAAAATYTPPPVQAPVAAPAVPSSYLVFFDFDKSDLTPQAAQIVDTAARNAATAKVTRIEVTGHTDTVGSDAYNLRLSQRRAQSVASAMEARGIPASEIAIFAKGKRDLLVPTGDGVREPQNRRVQIVYSGGGPIS